MNEPSLKKKSVINRIFKNQILITLSTIFLLTFILIGSSYALLNARTETGITDVMVQSGNLIASISSTSETIEMNYTTLGVSNEVGLGYDPYIFTVNNSGNVKIAYYELRIVDKEHEISTLPHKSINFALSKNGSDYTEPQNLGDNKSYIYVGGSLEPEESDTFNLKMWVNEEYGKYANNKEIKASIELTLYSDIPTRNYIIYDTQGGSYIPKSSVASKRISNQIPTKEGLEFAGWSTTSNGEVEYESNDIYDGKDGIILYAVWEKIVVMASNEIVKNLVSYDVASVDDFSGGLVAVNTNGTLYNENDANQTIREYRYSGPNVNNYVYFNCKDNDGTYNYGDPNYKYNETNCELWRIVGVFKNSQGNWNLKLVRNTVLQASELVSTYTIDGTTYDIGDGDSGMWNMNPSLDIYNYKTVTNDWTKAGLQYFLNTNYDSNGVEGYYSQITHSAKSIIDEDYIYYLGNVVTKHDEEPGYNGMIENHPGDTSISAYNNERSSVVCSSDIIEVSHEHNCNIWNGNSDKWAGSVSLLYPSDYGYMTHNKFWGNVSMYNFDDTELYTSWFYKTANVQSAEWLLSPASKIPSCAMILNYDFGVYSVTTMNVLGVRPVVNLKSNVVMLDGVEQNGSLNKPFVIISK